MKIRCLLVFAGIVALVGAPSGRVHAQALKGTLLGTITDSSGAVVPGVTIQINETATSFARTTVSNESGNYVFANLDPGLYRVEAMLPGFKKAVREGVELLVNSTVRVDLPLEAGGVAEVVQVSADIPLLQTDRADVGRQIEFRQLQDMPLPFNRNYQALINLVPGANRAFRPHSEFYNSQDSLSNRVNGQGRHFNNYQLEGIDNNWDDGNLTALVPPIEAISSVDVSTSNYEAEFGRASGAVVNVTLRSGTNAFHGSGFYFHKDERLAARNYFAQTKAPDDFNQFGFTFGGPIRRDRTFFFADYQGSRDHLGSTNRATIPTMAFREGDLSASTTTIYDPATGNPDGTGRLPFPGNRIPANRISPIARRILSFVPAPNLPGLGTNFEKNTVRDKTIHGFDIRVDHQFSQRDLFFMRYSFQRPVVFDPGLYGLYGGPRNDGFAGTGISRTNSPGLNYSHTFNPKLVTEVRFGLMRIRNDALNQDTGLQTSKEIGIPGANLDVWSSGLSEIRVNGYSRPIVGFSPSLPWNRAHTTFDVVNNWTRIASDHTVKFGFDLRRLRSDLQQTQAFNPRGRFTFTEGPTARNGDPRTSFANAFASFLLDQPNQIGRDLAVIFPAIRRLSVFTYLQDKWQVSQKLTIDVGLRHELWLSETPAKPGGFSNYDPETNSLQLAGIGKIPLNLGVDTPKKGFAPRFGLAYRISQRTVMRAGYGISYLFRSTNQQNFPVKQANSVDPSNSFSAAGSMATGLPAPSPVVFPADGIIRNAPPDVYSITPPNYPLSYVQSWNLALQRALPWNLALEAAYVGNHGVNIMVTRDINAGMVPGLGAAGQALNQRFGRRARTNIRIPSHSSYHALQTKFDRRFSSGFMLTTAYTFGKAIDLCTDRYCSIAINVEPRMNRGRSTEDITHVFVQSYLWDLPLGAKGRWLHSGPGRWFFGDWQVNGILTAQAGSPLNFTFSAATLNAPSNENRPNMLRRPEISGRIGPGQAWLDTSVFSAPAPNTFGTLGRNTMSGPGLVNFDFSLFRRFIVREPLAMEFRIEAFNLTNTPHFENPNTTFGSPNFGQVTTAQQDQRQFQLGVKFMF